MTSSAANPAAASAYWSAHKGYALNWYGFCAKEINARITGNPDYAPTPWAMRRHFGANPAQHLLEIGCLEGEKLARMKAAGLARRVSGVDYAAGAIARGQALYGDQVELSVMDLNEPSLKANQYDCILVNGVLHHITHIVRCVKNLYEALMPGGVMIASEFTGPRRYVYTPSQVATINAGVALLPPELREPFKPASLANKLEADPSESISTQTLKPVICSIFDSVDVIPFGGNVLMRALPPKVVSRIDLNNPEHVAGVEAIIAFDRAVTDRSHHMFFVARKT